MNRKPMSKNQDLAELPLPGVSQLPPTPPSDAPAWAEWARQAGADGALRAFAAVLTGDATSRSGLSTLLQVRPTTVSAWVAAMVRAGLVTELPSQPLTRGRPLGQLVANPDRLVASVLTVRSQALHLVTVNLLGQVLWHDSALLPLGGANEAMADVLRRLQQAAVARLRPDAALAGVGYALSGLVDVAGARWMFVSRWPAIRNLALHESTWPPATTVHVVRNMDAQLRARGLRRGDAGQGERTLLLHWGYGVGASFSAGRGALIDDSPGFGEVGHWRVAGQEMRCRCGQTGCLETVAALWAIGPQLLGRNFDDAMDETQAADLLRGMPLAQHPVFGLALQEMLLAVGNLCRIFFPTHLVVSGPFIENPGAWAAFKERFLSSGLLVDLPLPRLEAQHGGHQLEQEGAAMPLLLNGVLQLLRGPPAPDAAAPRKRASRSGRTSPAKPVG